MFLPARPHWLGLARRATDIESLFQSFFPELFHAAQADATLPVPLDLIENDSELIVRAELPGFEKSKLEVRLEDGLLTIRGEKRNEKKTDSDNVHLHETGHGVFTRSVRLPAGVDTAKVDAEYKDGILTVTLPKSETARSRKIDIR